MSLAFIGNPRRAMLRLKPDINRRGFSITSSSCLGDTTNHEKEGRRWPDCWIVQAAPSRGTKIVQVWSGCGDSQPVNEFDLDVTVAPRIVCLWPESGNRAEEHEREIQRFRRALVNKVVFYSGTHRISSKRD